MTAGPKSKALLQGGGLEELQVIIRPPPEEKPEALEAPKVSRRHHPIIAYHSLRAVCPWVLGAAFCMSDAEEYRHLHTNMVQLAGL